MLLKPGLGLGHIDFLKSGLVFERTAPSHHPFFAKELRAGEVLLLGSRIQIVP